MSSSDPPVTIKFDVTSHVGEPIGLDEFVEPTEPEMWVKYVLKNTTTSWPPQFTRDRRVIRIRDPGLAVRLATLLEADIKEKGW